MKRIALVCLTSAALAACSDSPTTPESADVALGQAVGQHTVNVTNSDDDGKGSFRWAVDSANLDPEITTIEVRGNNRLPILLQSSVTFSGTQDLTILGRDIVIDGENAGGTAFLVNGGGDLAIEGITYQVPSTATGTIKVSLTNVSIEDNKGHGVLINDQDNPVAEDGVQPDSSGSEAGLYVEVTNTSFLRNGYSVSDRDGLRVNEGAEGSLTFVARGLRAEDNAADGIELDERGSGDVNIDMQDSQVLRNGKFDPTDFDDGFDIDESDAGSVIGTLVRVTASDNYEEGLDFNENNAGDFRVDLKDVVTNNNDEEGVDYEEDDDFAGGGDLVTTIVGLEANGNGGDGGLKIREKGAGSLNANVSDVVANNNVVSGISVREDADGNLTASITNARTSGNAAHGIDFDENSTGNLVASVYQTISTANALFGLRADQQTPGTGSLLLDHVDLAGNTGGTTTGNNVTITIVP